MFWKDDMATGVPEIDERLRYFIESINATIRRMNSSRNPAFMSKYIEDIKNICVDYFSYQETMMTINNYRAYYQHKHDHEILFEKIGNVANEFMAGSFGFNTSQLENVFNEWFIRHVFMYDKPFGEYYKKIRSGYGQRRR